MNATIRAKRILTALTTYQKVDAQNFEIPKWVGDGLGAAIGRYQNDPNQGEDIWIFADGLAWMENGHTHITKYTEISIAKLLTGKESKGFILETVEGHELWFPVTGFRGRFYDSMEMLRFIDRVTQDVRGKK